MSYTEDDSTAEPSIAPSEELRSTPTDLQTLTPIYTDSSREPRGSASSSRLSSLSPISYDPTRPGNEWLKVLRREHTTKLETGDEPQYRVTPLIIVANLYRIRLITWRVDTGKAFEEIHQRVHKLTSNTQLELYAVEIGADTVTPATRQHFSANGGRGNFFLVCVPIPFVLQISIVGSSVPNILVSLNPMLAVSDLKKAIQDSRGYPPHRTDLIYKGIPLVNNERLYLYGLHNGDTIKLVLQRSHFVAVHFHTFWDRMYDLDIDVTSTVSEVLTMIVKRCVSAQTGSYSVDECYISSNAITIRTHDGKVLGPMDCISTGIDPNKADNYLSVIEDRTSDFYVTLSIEDEVNGEIYHIKAVEGAKLVSVYLRLHGLTHIPIDLMTLVGPGRTLNPFDNLHIQYHGTRLALLKQDTKSVQPLHMQRFDVIMPAESTVTVFVNKNGKIMDIKRRLQAMGYTDANEFSISHKDGVFHDQRALDRCYFRNDGNHVFLVRGEFNVDVVALRGEYRKVKLNDHMHLILLHQEGDNLYEPVRNNSQYIFCGDVLPPRRTAHRAMLQPGNMVFQDRTSKDVVLEILYGNSNDPSNSISIMTHRESITFELRRVLSDWRLSNWTLEALEQAIIWRNFPRPQAELLRSSIVTEVREDIYGVGNISDSRYRWGFTDIQASKVKLENSSEIERRAQKVRALLEIRDTKPQEYINLPPMNFYSEPLTLNYDHNEGISSLIGNRKGRIEAKNRTERLSNNENVYLNVFR